RTARPMKAFGRQGRAAGHNLGTRSQADSGRATEPKPFPAFPGTVPRTGAPKRLPPALYGPADRVRTRCAAQASVPVAAATATAPFAPPRYPERPLPPPHLE